MSGLVLLPSQLEEMPEEIPSHIGEGTLVKTSLTSIVAPSQAGKSFFMLHMVCCLAMCFDFFGLLASAEGVLVVVGEGFHGIRARLHAWCVHYGVAMERLDRRLAFLRVPLDISDDEMIARVLAELEQLSFTVDVIVFDTLSSNAPRGFNENDNSHMKGYMDCARALRDRLSWTIVFVAHTGQPNGAAANRAKGGYDFFASMDTEIFIENNGGVRTVKLSKSRDFPLREIGRFALHPSESSVVVVPVEGVAGVSVHTGEMLPSYRSALAALVERGMGMPISNQEWFYRSGLQKTAFYAAKKALLSAGYVAQDGKKFVPTNKADQLLKLDEESSRTFSRTPPSSSSAPPYKGGGANEPNYKVRELRANSAANQRNEGPGLEVIPFDVFDQGAA